MNIEIVTIFGAGALTLLTPCVLPMIPIYLAILIGQPKVTPGIGQRLSLFLSTLAFSFGLILVFVALGMTASTVGGLLAQYRAQLVLLSGLIVFLFGLKFLGLLRIGFLDYEKRFDDRRFATRSRLINGFILGVVFSLGWTPCVGPILGSVLTYTASSTSDPLRGALYLTAYSLGFVLPLLALSLFADAAQRIVGKITPWIPKLEKLSGLLLMGVGLYLLLGVSTPPPPSPTKATGYAPRAVIDPPLGQPTPRPRLVQFTSSSCSVCRQMLPTVALIERDCDGRQVDVVKINLAHAENLRYSTTYRIRGVPTFVFLDRQGRETSRLVGYQTLASLRQGLTALVGQSCEGLGLFQPDPADPASCKNSDSKQCGS